MAPSAVDGEIVSINLSAKKGTGKKPVSRARLVPGKGVLTDAHGTLDGKEWHRQVSLLAVESIGKMIAKGAVVSPGDFAENITTKGVDLLSLPVGTLLKLGQDVILRITQHGKECHEHCAIFQQVGDCVMPREGIFAAVVAGGIIKPGDPVELFDDGA